MRRLTFSFFILLCGFWGLVAHAQHFAVKTNALYWATTSINAGAEVRIAPKWTLDVSASYNPFTFSGNKKLKHFAIEPEARYWLCAPFAGHFVGADLLYTHYNAGGIKLPFGIYPDLADYRFQGDLGAVGLVYGYSWMLPNKRWSIEGVVGLGVGLTHHTQYACAVCGSKVGERTRGLFMPTKLALSIVYYIK